MFLRRYLRYFSMYCCCKLKGLYLRRMQNLCCLFWHGIVLLRVLYFLKICYSATRWYSVLLTALAQLESAKLRALRAKNMFTCQRALRAYVLTHQCALRALVPTCPACLRAHVPTCLACLRAHIPTRLACLRAHVPTC